MRASLSAVLTVLSLLLLSPFNSFSQITVDQYGMAVAIGVGEEQIESLVVANETERDVPYQVRFRRVVREQQRRVPQRDIDVGSRYALFFDGGESAWGYNMEQIFLDAEVDYSLFTHEDFGQIDLNQYDAIWVVFNRAGDAFCDAWNDNLAWAEEFVDRGGVYYGGAGRYILQVNPIHPGGLQDCNDSDGGYTGICLLNPGENPFVEYMGYERGTRIGGAAFCHHIFPEENLDNIENSNWHQAIMGCVDQNNRPAVVVYEYGGGFCIVTTTPDGFAHAHRGDNPWGNTGEALLWYMDQLAAPFHWINAEPESGLVPSNDETDIEFDFSAAEVEEGYYEAWIDLTFPEDEDYSIRMSALFSVGVETAPIVGEITDAATGEPLQGVKVALDGHEFERVTDADGEYILPNLPPNDYSLTITHEDYLPFTCQIQMEGERVVQNAALLQAVCSLSDNQILAHLSPDEETNIPFSITNEGNGPLNYRITKHLVDAPDFELWEQVRDIAIGELTDDDRIAGAAYDGENFFISGAAGDQPNTIYVINREGELIRQFDQQGGSRYGMKDLEYDGEWFWGSGSDSVWAFNAEGERTAAFRGPFNPVNSIAFDSNEDILWLSGITTDILGYDRQGNALGRRLVRRGLRIYGLGYWPDDPDNYCLYALTQPAAESSVIFKINTENGDTLRTGSPAFDENASGVEGFAVSRTYNHNSWVAMAIENRAPANGSDHLKIFHMATRLDWFNVEPLAGVIEAGEEQEFELILNSADYPEVVLEGEMLIDHNGLGSRVVLPVTLDIHQANREIAVRQLRLSRGLNLVSLNVEPEPMPLADLLSPLLQQGLLNYVKDGKGHFFRPGNNFNNIPGWDCSQGYFVKVSGYVSLPVEGVEVYPDQPIELSRGWQLVSYFPRDAVDASTALSGIAGHLRAVKDGRGDFYIPRHNFNNIGHLREGQGYQVCMNQPARLVYQFEGDRVALASSPSIYDHPGHFELHEPTATNMSLLLEAPGIDGEIGVYAGGDLVGIGLISNGRAGVAVWGDEHLTEEVDGAMEGEEFAISLWNGSEEIPLSVDWIEGDSKFQADGFAYGETKAVIQPVEYSLTSAYPNPFNNTTTIIFSLANKSEVTLRVFDFSGREVAGLVNGPYAAGESSSMKVTLVK